MTQNIPDRPGYHRLWVNADAARIRERLEWGYTFVYDGKERIRRSAGPYHQVLMEIPEYKYEAILAGAQDFTAYLSSISCTLGPYAQKNEGEPYKLIPESPPGDHGKLFDWAHFPRPLFAWVPPGRVLRGYTNWYWDRTMFRIIFRPTTSWTLYIRVRFKPSFKFDFVPETVQQFNRKWD